MKTCTRCRETKPLDEFAQHKRGKQSACKPCQRIVSAEWYANNKARHKQNVVSTAKTMRKQYAVWKRTLSCKLCGEDEACCIDLHHIDPTQKDMHPSASLQALGWPRFIEEVNKCVPLCANCHRKVHKGLLTVHQSMVLNVTRDDFASIA